MVEYVVGFLYTTDKKKVVLIRKTKPAWQAGKLNGVGGKIEKGESPTEAMIREFEEETGYKFEDWTQFATMHNSQFIVHCFTGFSEDLPVETKTEELVKVVTVMDVLSDEYIITGNLKWLISMSLDSGFYPVTITYFEEDKYQEPVK